MALGGRPGEAEDMTIPAPGAPPAVRIASARGRWILLTTVLGSSMALLDSTVVNVALPGSARTSVPISRCSSGRSTPTC